MKIKINSSGQVVSIEDYLLVQNANFLNTNNITLEFNEDFSTEQLNNFYTARLTVELADGRTLYNLAMPKSISDGQVRFIHEVTNDSQIFSVNGSISISIQVLSSSNGVLATVKSRAVVQENTGISNAEEYDTALSEFDATLVQPLEARVNDNLITLDNKFKNFWQLAGSLPFAYDIDNLQAGSYYASLSSGNINVPASGILYALSSSVPKLQIVFGVDNYIYQRSKTSNDTTWSEWFKSTSQVEVNSLQSQITELVNRLNNLVIGGQTDIFIIVDELPEEGYANKIYLVPIADGETPNVFDEYLWVYSHWEYFGRSSLNLDLSEYVKFTDYATADKAGVVKGTAYASQGVLIKPDGTLQTVYATDNEITNKSSYYKIICPKNMDHAWKVSATTNTEEWRNEDKTAACETIGAVRPLYVDNLIAQCGTWTPITISESNIELNVNENGGTFTKYLSDFSIKYNAKLRLLNVTGRIRIDTTSGWVGTPTVYVNITHLKSSIGNINTDTKFSAVQFILANNSNQLQQNEGAVLIVDNTQFKAVAIETFQNRRDAGKYCFVFNNTIPY